MSKKKGDTASFMIRFTQKIYEEGGEENIQWRGSVSHVQGGDQLSFSEFNEAMQFIHEKLKELTLDATKDKSKEAQDGLLNKSFYIWKKMASSGPSFLIETIKDPKKQVSNIQDQIQDQISILGGEISSKMDIDNWRNASRTDLKKVLDAVDQLSGEVKKLTKKVDKLSTKNKKK